MRIRMLTSSAGPKGVLDAEAVVDVPDAKAKELIDSYHAEAVEADVKPTARWPHGVELSAKSKGDSK